MRLDISHGKGETRRLITATIVRARSTLRPDMQYFRLVPIDGLAAFAGLGKHYT